ncbi:MAG: hypothetical protein H0T18_05720, partial [Chloroflexia bacterium]|nr:hypothetical protein [Chloroflexia bacterium]
MRHSNVLMAGIVLVGGIGLATLTRVSANDEAAPVEPSHVEAIEGTDLKRVTLSERAAERLGIETVPVVEEQADGKVQMSIPYSAVVYDENGGTWAYTTAEPLVFVRDAIGVERIDGDTAYLTEGPDAGTEVVTV